MTLEEPFPLKTQFRLRFIPALLGFIGVFLVIVGITAHQIVESIYLELAQRRAQTIARAVAEQAPVAWQGLMTGKPLDKLDGIEKNSSLTDAFDRKIRELNLKALKVYDLNRKVLYATHPEEIAKLAKGEALINVIEEGIAGIVKKTLTDGTEQYEFYVPVFDDAGTLRMVFELYEPVNYLNTILLQSAVQIITIPGLLFMIFAFTLDRLVCRAQLQINTQTAAVNALRKRIESFVSATAVTAAKSADQTAGMVSKKITTTLFFSDIRDFTGFSEQNEPETVVEFLNRIMALQVSVINRHGGDVDKMIGDAVLARFDGADGNIRAISAAKEILTDMKSGDYYRSLGIGLYRGQVISGAIGPENRRDYTVIGDAVNIAAHLCSAATAGEIVVDAPMADDTFDPEESINIKSRKQLVAVRRLRINA